MIIAGAIFALVQIIMTDVVSLRERYIYSRLIRSSSYRYDARGKYQAIIATVSAIGSGVGPVIGGAFAQRASWRVRNGLLFAEALTVRPFPV
jgi:MFS family permease